MKLKSLLGLGLIMMSAFGSFTCLANTTFIVPVEQSISAKSNALSKSQNLGDVELTKPKKIKHTSSDNNICRNTEWWGGVTLAHYQGASFRYRKHHINRAKRLCRAEIERHYEGRVKIQAR